MRDDVDDVLRVQPAPSDADWSHDMGFGKGALTLIITRTLGPRPHVSLAAFSLPYCSTSFDSHGGIEEFIEREGDRGRERGIEGQRG